MKKFIYILILVLITIFSVTGCNKDKSAPENPATADTVAEGAVTADSASEDSSAKKDDEVPEIDTSKLLSNSYAQLFKSGNYLLKFRGVVDLDPDDIFSEVTFAREGDNALWIIEAEGSKSHIVTKGDAAFMIDEASKSYITGTISNMETSLINGESLVYSSEGEEIINGMRMIYEEYTYDIGTLKFFFNKEDKKKLYAILNTNPVETVMMEITEFSENITPDMFEIPAGYKEI